MRSYTAGTVDVQESVKFECLPKCVAWQNKIIRHKVNSVMRKTSSKKNVNCVSYDKPVYVLNVVKVNAFDQHYRYTFIGRISVIFGFAFLFSRGQLLKNGICSPWEQILSYKNRSREAIERHRSCFPL